VVVFNLHSCYLFPTCPICSLFHFPTLRVFFWTNCLIICLLAIFPHFTFDSFNCSGIYYIHVYFFTVYLYLIWYHFIYNVRNFTQQTFISRSSGSWTSEIKGLQGCLFWGLSPCPVAGAAFSECLPITFALCVCVLISSFSKDTARLDQGPPQWPHLTLTASLKNVSPNTVSFWNPGD